MSTKVGRAEQRGRRSGAIWRWLIPATVLLVWFALGGVAGPYAGKLSEVAENDNAAFLPASAESTVVSEERAGFVDELTIPIVVVWEIPDGLPSDATDQAAQQLASASEAEGIVGPASPPIPAEDGRALTAVLTIDASFEDEIDAVVDEVRETVVAIGEGSVYVTGPGGFIVDLGAAFAGIDGLLLAVALGVVLVILLIVYRSPILPFLVLLTAVLGLGVAAFTVYMLADAGTLTLNGQSQGIMSILVVGAATDYSLLLVARYREELREHERAADAMRVALRQALGPIVASGGTVIAGVLCLLFSDLNSNRSLGPVAAIGIAGSILVALTFLPAALALLGRAAFWPRRPTYGSEHRGDKGVWGRVAGVVSRRPRRLWVGVSLVLVALAAMLPLFRADGVSQSELFLQDVESVQGQEALVRHFPGGAGSPAVVVADADDLAQVLELVNAHEGVDSARPVSDTPQAAPGAPADADPKVVDGRVIIEATLADAPDSDGATQTIRDLRSDLDEVGESALVGGTTAQQLDTNDISERDRTIIIPIVLVVILAVLMVLLRSILAPVLLILTVVLSFAATLGVAGFVFDNVFGWPGADPGVPLFAFVFLVALGIDYNIFLMTRVREEAVSRGTRPGILRGLVVTGGVITSAGIVLAATFSALGVIPILFLAQIAFLVAFGVLLDTFVVRSLLVPALSYDLGSRIWWPSRLTNDAAAPVPKPEAGHPAADDGDPAAPH